MNRPLVAAWFAMAALVVAGFFHVQSLANRVEDETRVRAHTLCISVRESKEAVMTMTEALRQFARNQADLHEGGESPEQEEARDQFVEDVRSSIGDQPCPPSPQEQEGRNAN